MNASTLTGVTNAYVQPAINLRKVSVKILTSAKLKFVVFMETVRISKEAIDALVIQVDLTVKDPCSRIFKEFQ